MAGGYHVTESTYTTRAGPIPRATCANVTSLRIAANIQNPGVTAIQTT